MRGKKRTLVFGALVVGILAFAVLISSCGGDDGDDSGTSNGADDGEDLPVVAISGFDRGTGTMLLQAIESEGLDEENGFQLDALYVDPGVSEQTFLQGESDVSLHSDPLTSAIAQIAGQDSRSFQPLIPTNSSITVPADSPYETPEDLVGERVGHESADSGTSTLMAALLQREFGIDMFEDYELVEAQEPALVELLRTGQIEAMLNDSPETERAIAEADGRVIYEAGDAIEEPFEYGLVYATALGSWLDENEDTALKVRDALVDAVELFKDSDFELLREDPYAGNIDVDAETMDAVVERANEIPLFDTTWSDDSAEAANDFIEALAEEGTLIDEQPPNPPAITLEGYYEGAYE